jgi:hypothetical protein
VRPDTGQEHAVTLELSRLLRISTRFARSFTLRFAEQSADNAFCEREPLRDAIALSRELRVVPFPPLPPAPLQGLPQEELKPDLMIAGIGPGKRWLFQLLLEVKILAPLEHTWVAGRKVAQPAALAAVWDEIHPRDAAQLRYVGTISRGDLPDWRADAAALSTVYVQPARDVLWVPELELSVRQALREMPPGERARFEPELHSFLDHVNTVAPELGLGSGDSGMVGRVRRQLAAGRVRRQRERAAGRTAVA